MKEVFKIAKLVKVDQRFTGTVFLKEDFDSYEKAVEGLNEIKDNGGTGSYQIQKIFVA